MKNRLFFICLMLFSFSLWSQEIQVEYDKSRDFSIYKTFRFGEGEVITPQDQKVVTDRIVNGWITSAVTRELELRGLTRLDSGKADLVVSYVAGTVTRSDMGNLGPMGMTPGSTDRAYVRDYQQGSLIIDLNDRSGIKIWRVNSTTNMMSAGGEQLVDQIVQRGFRKFGKPAKKKKKK